MVNERQPEQLQDWQRQALLKQYEICEQDNAANSQVYWSLAGIFIAVSTALLAGLIYGIVSNDSLFSSLISQNEPHQTLIVGITALIVGAAMIIILILLKGWLRRIQFNQRINQEIMREIELTLGMSKWWRIRAIDKYNELKKSTKCEDQKVEEVTNKIGEYLTDYEKKQLRSDISKLVNTVDFSRYCVLKQKYQNKIHYEPPSSKKHHPCIFNTLILLWVIVVSLAIFLIVDIYHPWYYGLIASVLIVADIIYFYFDIKNLNKI